MEYQYEKSDAYCDKFISWSNCLRKCLKKYKPSFAKMSKYPIPNWQFDQFSHFYYTHLQYFTNKEIGYLLALSKHIRKKKTVKIKWIDSTLIIYIPISR